MTDAEEILQLQKTAYLIEAERYHDYTIHPLRQTLAEIKEQVKTMIVLKAVSDGNIVGTVRAYKESETCYVGKLAVLPEKQNQGIGTALMQAIEKYFRPKRFELFVGSKSDNNINLYQKLGYTPYKSSRYECGNIEILYMEKTNNDR